jgi:hypothetical protein
MKSAFSRRGPDIVTEELAAVLSKGGSFEFKPLFDVIHANLRLRNAANGGEEMLRLRAYEKLQNLVQQGIVTKTAKEYQGVAPALKRFLAAAAEQNAKTALGSQAAMEARKKAASTASKTSLVKEEPVTPRHSPSVTTPKASKNANTELPVRKAEKGLGQKSQERRKTTAKA